MSPALPTSFRAVVLDIEGTTTAMSFVYDTLFPFVRRRLGPFIAAHWDEPAIRDEVRLLAEQADADVAAGVPGAVPIPRHGDAPKVQAAVIANVLWQMDGDRKTTGLKALQGRIWRQGYQYGDLKGHVYDDVPGALHAWDERGVPVYIYSSGSVAAQKLLFGFSVAGDLTPLLAGYFDTTTGPKRVAASYGKIAAAIGHAASDVLFATDNLDEAVAAREAGMLAVVARRPGNLPVPDGHGFPEVTSLAELV